MRILIATIFILLFVSCSSSQTKSIDYSNLNKFTDQDYIDHLASLGMDYTNKSGIQEIRLSAESVRFLDQIYERIAMNNEILFTQNIKPTFHIISNVIPFVFSLPHAQFYISSGIIEKYLKSEEIFVAALAGEMLKSTRNIYEKKIMIPLGFYGTEKMIYLTRLRQETKFKINEWAYVILKRAGYDSSAYLNWIQVQNRNTLDFSFYLGDAVGISKEEHLFKSFIGRQGDLSFEKKPNEANSSKAFYKLLNNIASKK